jgi:Pentapeptide repeats (8 copies)
MDWLKRDIWKAGFAIAGMVLLLVLMVWVPVSARADERASGLATPVTGTVQATSTEDATVTALNKEKLAQEVQQLQKQNNLWQNWLFNGSTAFIAAFATLAVAFFGLYQWRGNRNDERQKERDAQAQDLKDKAEERFKIAITGLGDEKEGARIGGAILLRSFLNEDDKGYERYYSQIFDLAVAYLRFPRTPHPPTDPTAPLPLTTLSQALVAAFKEAYRLARNENRKKGSSGDLPESFDASDILLDNAYLSGADLDDAWMPRASLRGADLRGTYLRRAKLSEADLRGAFLHGAYLSGTDLHGADFSGAKLNWTPFGGTGTGDDRDFLGNTNLRRVKGLTKEQLEACKAKGAIIDEDTTVSSSPSPVAPSPPLRSNDVQASLASSAQVNTLIPDTDGSSTTLKLRSKS